MRHCPPLHARAWRCIGNRLCCAGGMKISRPLSVLAIGVLTLALVQCGGGSSSGTTPSPTPLPAPSPAPSPSPAPTGGSLSISPQSIQGQGQPQGTVTLGSAAPSSGMVVQLASSNTGVAKVPASVTVAGGSRTATFTIDTSTVQSPTAVVITASANGVSMSATLTVTAGTVNAGFVVRSTSRGAGACVIDPDAVDFDCVLDGSQSSGPVAAWIWTYTMGTNTLGHTSSTANSHPQIATKCAFLSTATGGDSPNGERYLNMSVTLQVRDFSGNVSNTVQQAVKVYPNKECGFSY